MRLIKTLIGAITLWMIAPFAYAHEAYVLDKNYFWQHISDSYSLQALDALNNTSNLKIAGLITGSVLVVLTLNFLFRRTKIARKLGASVEKFAPYGPLIVRISIAVAFFYSAHSMSFLGPELSLSYFVSPSFIQSILYLASIFIFLGLFTEIAALAVLIVYIASFFIFGGYMFTYLNYFGEIVILFLFGMHSFSLDKFFFKRPLFFPRFARAWRHYETTIVRIAYGVALIYAAITVKFLHPLLTTTVVTKWHLTQFHWLFPSDPLLVVFGAALAEIAIGLFIVLGFELRLTVLISLFYITLSLLYFQELVWPHLMLYGISFNLLVQPETFSLDHLLLRKHWNTHKWWHRPFLPHQKKAE